MAVRGYVLIETDVARQRPSAAIAEFTPARVAVVDRPYDVIVQLEADDPTGWERDYGSRQKVSGVQRTATAG
jgi:hypothetical protein